MPTNEELYQEWQQTNSPEAKIKQLQDEIVKLKTNQDKLAIAAEVQLDK